MTPKSREEIYLNAIIGNEEAVPTPIARIELFLKKIFESESDVPTPVTRAELFLSKVAGNNVDIPTPQTRVEMYLAKIAGEDIEVPVPVTRVEWFLNEWANGASPRVLTTMTGMTPLTLANAIASSIKSLVQYGKVTTSNGDMYCNNGKLVAMDDELPSGYERQIGFEFAAATYYLIQDFHLRGSDTVRLSFSADKACNVFGCYTTNSATDNYSLYASTSSGGKYLRYDSATYSSYIPSAQIGERIDAVITPNETSGMPTDSVITPEEFEATADLCIGTTSTSASSSKLDGNIWGSFVVDGRLTLIPCKRLSDDALGYYDLDSDTFYEPVGSAPTSLGVDTSHLTALSVEGTAEVLTVGEQAATVENLLAVDDIKDEQNIISGVVTRRCEAEISDGTTPSGRYIGTVGEGNIIVKARETGYEGDVATFEADRAEPLNGLTVNVSPIQDLHGYDSPWPAGGGVNKLDPTGVTVYTSSTYGFSLTWNANEGSYNLNGTYTGTNGSASFRALNAPSSVSELNVKGFSSSPNFSQLRWQAGTNQIVVELKNMVQGTSYNITIYPLVYEGSTAPTAWSPYSNICPISGRTSATIYHSGADTSDPTTYTIALGDTVYGGTLDVTAGKMVVDRVKHIVNGTEARVANQPMNDAVYRTGIRIVDFAPNATGADAVQVLCNIGRGSSRIFGEVAEIGDCALYTVGGIACVLIGVPIAYNTTQAANQWLIDNNCEFVAKIATPFEIPLTPTQIETLIGTNNIWSDAGPVKAYVADGDVIEHVTAQPMRTAEGNNTVAVTSEIGNVDLSVEYYIPKSE